MERVLKTRFFGRWMRKTELSDPMLCLAVREMAHGLIDAELGGGVVKKRVPLPGRGKRGSARALLATDKNDRWFFVFGFEKNQRKNVTLEELEALRHLADDLLGLDQLKLDGRLRDGSLTEICHASL